MRPTVSSKKLPDLSEVNNINNHNFYNDKELFEDGDLNWYDYGYRNYDPQIGRFTQLDPLTDEYPELTNYQYASCEPIANVDVDGLEGQNIVNRWVNGSYLLSGAAQGAGGLGGIARAAGIAGLNIGVNTINNNISQKAIVGQANGSNKAAIDATKVVIYISIHKIQHPVQDNPSSSGDGNSGDSNSGDGESGTKEHRSGGGGIPWTTANIDGHNWASKYEPSADFSDPSENIDKFLDGVNGLSINPAGFEAMQEMLLARKAQGALFELKNTNVKKFIKYAIKFDYALEQLNGAYENGSASGFFKKLEIQPPPPIRAIKITLPAISGGGWTYYNVKDGTGSAIIGNKDSTVPGNGTAPDTIFHRPYIHHAIPKHDIPRH